MRLYLTILIILLATTLNAQNVFILKGKIEFEKKVNVIKQLEANVDENEMDWINSMKKTLPQYKITYFDLYFDETKSLYKPGREVVAAQPVPEWFIGPANDNTIYNDLSQQQITAQK